MNKSAIKDNLDKNHLYTHISKANKTAKRMLKEPLKVENRQKEKLDLYRATTNDLKKRKVAIFHFGNGRAMIIRN